MSIYGCLAVEPSSDIHPRYPPPFVIALRPTQPKAVSEVGRVDNTRAETSDPTLLTHTAQCSSSNHITLGDISVSWEDWIARSRVLYLRWYWMRSLMEVQDLRTNCEFGKVLCSLDDMTTREGRGLKCWWLGCGLRG